MKRVLLVEDLPQVAQHLQAMLAREQDVEMAGVHTAADAALTQITTEKPEIVMIDALLQGKLSGFDLAKKIRDISPGTKIVMVTVPQRPIEPKPDQAIDAVFVLPGGANELGVALGVGKGAPKHKGTIVAMYSPKGGTGRHQYVGCARCTSSRNEARRPQRVQFSSYVRDRASRDRVSGIRDQ